MDELAASNAVSKAMVQQVINRVVSRDAGTRDPTTKKDTTTCFGIPGSGLPRRHCNVDINVTVLVCQGKQVFMSINNGAGEDTGSTEGHIYQSVYGQNYICRIYAYPTNFDLTIPVGSSSWDDVQFTSNGADVTSDVKKILVTEGTLSKGQDISNKFDWVFGESYHFEAGQTYSISDIVRSKTKTVDQNGGSGTSDSRFTDMGVMSTYAWKTSLGTDINDILDQLDESEKSFYEELSDEEKAEAGVIYICGGIMYKTAVVDSAITATAVPIIIPGLKSESFYFPADIQKGNDRMSCDRTEGGFWIKKTEAGPEYLKFEDGWREVKNTTNDKATQEVITAAKKAAQDAEGDDGDYHDYLQDSDIQNWGFRLENGEWIRLILTGVGGVPDGEDVDGVDGGIGSDSASSSTMDNCCCIQAANIIAASISNLK